MTMEMDGSLSIGRFADQRIPWEQQIQFLLGHASVQTTERYLGCKQKLSQSVNDNLGLEDT
jgi:integrase